MNKLETLNDIVADKYDGCYEVMRECVMAYANVDTNLLDFNDLDLVLMIPIGTWTVSTDKKVALVKASHLEDDSKVKLISLMEEVDKRQKMETMNILRKIRKGDIGACLVQLLGLYQLFPMMCLLLGIL